MNPRLKRGFILLFILTLLAASAAAVALQAPTELSPCKLPDLARRGNVGLGFPPISTRMPSTGTVSTKVLFVDFPDAPAAEAPGQAFSRISPGGPDFFKAVSYGRMTYRLEPHFSWLRMSKPSPDYQFRRGMTFAAHRAYIQEAITLADAAVDFSGVQAVVVIANPQATAISVGPALTPVSARDALVVDGNVIHRAVTSGSDLSEWGFLWLNHEVGHTMGLVDLYRNAPARTANTDEFVGNFSVMGHNTGKAPEPLAYERWLLGWLDDDQILCLQQGAVTTTLSAIETAGGVKAVMVPTGMGTAVVVESRRALGYDNKLVKPGALVYSIDTSITSGEGPIKILPVIPGDRLRDQSPRAAGESVTIGEVTVRVIVSSSTTDTVQVTTGR